METEGSFDDLPLCSWMKSHLQQLGYSNPSPVQYNCIPPILDGKDCMGCSKTGSGKTAAFAIPVLQKLSEDPYGIFCLVLSPTRELAFQIAEQFSLLGQPISVRTSVVIGGMSLIQQAKELSKKPHIVIATPGRLADHIRSNKDMVPFTNLKFLIIDEADRLLDKLEGDFSKDLKEIFDVLPKKRQTLLFSATLTDTLKELQSFAMNKPFYWEAKKTVETVIGLDQKYILLPEHVRDGYLVYICKDILEKHPKHSILIFTKTCRNCHLLGMLLEKVGFDCVVLHSVMNQRNRLAALFKFKSSSIKILIATDVAARGLDIPVVQVVINHNIPGVAKNYIHRVGRTARAGRSGMAISLVTQFDIHRVHAIEEAINTKLTEYSVNENEVLKILTEINILKREAELKMEQNKFGERKENNKRKQMILEGKDPEEEIKKQKKEKIRKIKMERRERLKKKSKMLSS